MLTLTKLEMTMEDTPTEWEGKTGDNRSVYIRYRAGRLRVFVSRPGGDWLDALHYNDPVYEKQITREMEGILSTEEMLAATGITVAKVC